MVKSKNLHSAIAQFQLTVTLACARLIQFNYIIIQCKESFAISLPIPLSRYAYLLHTAEPLWINIVSMASAFALCNRKNDKCLSTFLSKKRENGGRGKQKEKKRHSILMLIVLV